MENEKMGQFILELRKSKQMTQKELAAKLNITDKAVSKWERGISCPDISLLSTIAEVLGVTTGELLNGERKNCSSGEDGECIDNALRYVDKTARNRAKSLQNLCAIVFSLLLLIGIAVCAICDLAISGRFTWSLFPISSIVFAWLTLFPVIKFGERGIYATMIALSVFIIPFLSVLDRLVDVTDMILPVGIRASVISVVFLWVVLVLFKRLKRRKLLAGAITLLLAVPVYMLINFSISRIISQPVIDVWDVIGYCVCVAAAVSLFAADWICGRKRRDGAD